ncbi:MAG: replicative DNA helicase [Aggregatilineales bacterium]
MIIDVEIPYSEEAERALVGSVLMYSKTFYEAAKTVNEHDFFLLRHRYIWQSFNRILSRNESIDPLTVSEDLKTRNLLSDIGGDAYLIQLTMRIPTSVNAMSYAFIIERCSLRRRLMELADGIKILAADTDMGTSEITSIVHSETYRTIGRNKDDSGDYIGEDIDNFSEIMTRQLEDTSYTPGISSGFKNLDNVYQGWDEGQLIIIAGRPAMGKSVLMLWLALAAIKATQKPIVFFSTEMGRKQVIRRLITILSSVPTTRLKNPRLMGEQDWRAVSAAKQYLKSIQHLLYINAKGKPKPSDIRIETERLMQRHGLAAVFVDGFYRMGSDERSNSLHERFGQIAMDMKTLAGDMALPVIGTHQLNRSVENRNDKRPVASDLRESGKLEEEADIIMLLFREAVYDQELGDPNKCEIICGKHRDGAQMTTLLHFDNTTLHFKDALEHTVDLIDI